MDDMLSSKNSHDMLLEEESEFQVLSRPPSNVNGTFSHLNDLHLNINSASCDLSPEEIQTRLRDLLKENLQLRDILHQNNVSMNEQFQRLLQWQQEMTKAEGEQRKKFEEARLLVHRLRQENEDFEKQLQNSSVQNCKKCESLEKENKLLKQQLTCHDSEKNRLTVELKQLHIVELQLKDELSTLSSANDELKTKLHHLVIEKQELTAMNSELNAKLATCRSISPVQNVRESNENPSFVFVSSAVNLAGKEDTTTKKDKYSITELLLQLHMEQNRSTELKNQLEEEQRKSDTLNKQLEEARQCFANPLQRENCGMCLLRELKESGKKFNIADSYLERYMERCDSLENWLGAYQGQLEKIQSPDNGLIDKLRIEISNLRKALNEQQAQNQGDRKDLLEAQERFESLLKDYQSLLKSWELFEQEQLNKGKQSEAYYEIQMKTLNEQIDNLTAKLVCSDEALSSKANEVNVLKDQLNNSGQGVEKIEVLEAQVEIYRTDFKMEKELRENIQREKDQFTAENRLLNLQVKQLQEELRHCQQTNLLMSQQIQGRHKTLRFGESSGLSRKEKKTLMKSASDLGSSEWRNSPQMGARTRMSPVGSATCFREGAPASCEDNMYFCPKCNLGFTDLQPLENHVNSCLDKEDPFI